MNETSQRRAVDNYRDRLTKRGMARFEVIGLDKDRELVRSIARRLAEAGPDAVRLRVAVQQSTSEETCTKGEIYRALRNSPLVGADLDFSRPRNVGRKIELG